jgi:hypothetical protein
MATISFRFADAPGPLGRLTPEDLALLLAQLEAMYIAASTVSVSEEIDSIAEALEHVVDMHKLVGMLTSSAPPGTAPRFQDPLLLAWGAVTILGDLLQRKYAGWQVGRAAVLVPGARLHVERFTYASPVEIVVSVFAAGAAGLSSIVLFVEAMRRVYRSSRGFELDRARIDTLLAQLDADTVEHEARRERALEDLRPPEQRAPLELESVQVEISPD